MNPLLDYRVPTQYYFSLANPAPAQSSSTSTSSSTTMPSTPQSPRVEAEDLTYHAMAAGLGCDIPSEVLPEIIERGALSPPPKLTLTHGLTILGDDFLEEDEPTPLTSENLVALEEATKKEMLSGGSYMNEGPLDVGSSTLRRSISSLTKRFGEKGREGSIPELKSALEAAFAPQTPTSMIVERSSTGLTSSDRRESSAVRPWNFGAVVDKILEREKAGASGAEEKKLDPQEAAAEEKRRKMKRLLGKALNQLKK
ncbi:hypothetical protein BDD12DRAFT_889595 [Trichophaea hybrida]|nr:hypothetical protein BDD12DRAFT_889595 [Trichophaea hybrida]